jgi:anti-sigma regulatory factor (Ser/Thr protein kinase)
MGLMSATVRGTEADREIIFTTLPDPTVPGLMRSLLDHRLARLKLDKVIFQTSDELRHDILLTVSELVTNACDATPHREITFKAVFEHRSLWVGVWDASRELPQPKTIAELAAEDIEPDPDALNEGYESKDIGGWGLPLIMGLSQDRSITPTPPEGKWVWARFTFSY